MLRFVLRNVVLIIGMFWFSVGFYLVVNTIGTKERGGKTGGTYEEEVRSRTNDERLLRIIWCESRFKQFRQDGSVVTGKESEDGYDDIGIFQIHLNPEHGHVAAAQKLLGSSDGLKSLMTFEGNWTYGKYLYDHDGTRHWNSSRECWGGGALAPEYASR